MKEKETENKEKKEAEESYYPREQICSCCGKKYMCYGYSQTICMNCMDEYADAVIKSNLYD